MLLLTVPSRIWIHKEKATRTLANEINELFLLLFQSPILE